MPGIIRQLNADALEMKWRIFIEILTYENTWVGKVFHCELQYIDSKVFALAQRYGTVIQLRNGSNYFFSQGRVILTINNTQRLGETFLYFQICLWTQPLPMSICDSVMISRVNKAA